MESFDGLLIYEKIAITNQCWDNQLYRYKNSLIECLPSVLYKNESQAVPIYKDKEQNLKAIKKYRKITSYCRIWKHLLKRTKKSKND